jgi:hypothetical protein
MNEKWNGEEWVLFSEAIEESESGLARPEVVPLPETAS